MPITRVGPKYQVTIPKETRAAVGMQVGDYVETSVSNGVVVLRMKDLVDRHPAVEARLAEAEADVQAGRVHGPFASVQGLTRSLRGAARRGRKRIGKSTR